MIPKYASEIVWSYQLQLRTRDPFLDQFHQWPSGGMRHAHAALFLHLIVGKVSSRWEVQKEPGSRNLTMHGYYKISPWPWCLQSRCLRSKTQPMVTRGTTMSLGTRDFSVLQISQHLFSFYISIRLELRSQFVCVLYGPNKLQCDVYASERNLDNFQMVYTLK